ncbi:hypothetical protein BsWGS_27578 [Bradybaena similaris]
MRSLCVALTLLSVTLSFSEAVVVAKRGEGLLIDLGVDKLVAGIVSPFIEELPQVMGTVIKLVLSLSKNLIKLVTKVMSGLEGIVTGAVEVILGPVETAEILAYEVLDAVLSALDLIVCMLFALTGGLLGAHGE